MGTALPTNQPEPSRLRGVAPGRRCVCVVGELSSFLGPERPLARRTPAEQEPENSADTGHSEYIRCFHEYTHSQRGSGFCFLPLHHWRLQTSSAASYAASQ